MINGCFPPCLVQDQQLSGQRLPDRPQHARLQTAFEYFINGLTVAQLQQKVCRTTLHELQDKDTIDHSQMIEYGGERGGFHYICNVKESHEL